MTPLNRACTLASGPPIRNSSETEKHWGENAPANQAASKWYAPSRKGVHGQCGDWLTNARTALRLAGTLPPPNAAHIRNMNFSLLLSLPLSIYSTIPPLKLSLYANVNNSRPTCLNSPHFEPSKKAIELIALSNVSRFPFLSSLNEKLSVAKKIRKD